MHEHPFTYLKRRTWELALKILEKRSSHRRKRKAKRDPGMSRREETLGHFLGYVTLKDFSL